MRQYFRFLSSFINLDVSSNVCHSFSEGNSSVRSMFLFIVCSVAVTVALFVLMLCLYGVSLTDVLNERERGKCCTEFLLPIRLACNCASDYNFDISTKLQTESRAGKGEQAESHENCMHTQCSLSVKLDGLEFITPAQWDMTTSRNSKQRCRRFSRCLCELFTPIFSNRKNGNNVCVCVDLFLFLLFTALCVFVSVWLWFLRGLFQPKYFCCCIFLFCAQIC